MGRSEQRDETPDESLVEQAGRGDEAAFELLLRRHEGRVLRVLRLLGVPRQDREDVAQEVFVRVFRHLQGYRRQQAFSGWVYRIAVNASHDYHGRRARRAAEGGWGEGIDESADAAPGPGEIFDQRDSRRRLETALLRISERERAVFVLRELEGLDTPQVARALGITRITVRRHLGRARAHLRELLARGGPDEKKQGSD